MTGKELYEMLGLQSERFGLGKFTGWEKLMTQGVHEVYDATAASFKVSHDLRALLKKYGRHHPLCTTGQECTCGFEEVERKHLIQ